MTELTIDARVLTEFQACKRRFLLDHDWRVLKYRPKSLFDACLRRAITQLSSAADPIACASDARAQFMQSAANPGLDTDYQPYQIAKDYCAMLETVIRSVARLTLLTVKDVPPTRLTSSVGWRFYSQQDDSGTLHRWITVDRWGPEVLTREMHSWWVLGDIAMARAPMQLHVIEIGQQRDGRRASPWARGWKHPGLPALRMRFLRKDGQSFSGWKPHYLADDPSEDVAEWVDQLWREGAAQQSMHHVTVNAPTDWVCDDTARQVLQEAVRMREMIEERGSIGWRALPMSRGQCDGMVPCPFQDACYQTAPIEPGQLGLYQLRAAARYTTQNDVRSIRIPVVV